MMLVPLEDHQILQEDVPNLQDMPVKLNTTNGNPRTEPTYIGAVPSTTAPQEQAVIPRDKHDQPRQAARQKNKN